MGRLWHGNRTLRPGVRGRMFAQPSRPLVLVLAAALAVAACGSATASGPPAPSPGGTPLGEPSGAPTPTPAGPQPADAIDHPAGPTDVVLRATTQGGFVRMEWVMGRVPEFTLYGDGRVLLLPEGAEMADPATPTPLREARLPEDDVQRLLAFALTEGRLGVAREAYLGGNMDAPSTVFEVHAGGLDKTVLVTGLTAEPAPGPDSADMTAFAELLARLRSIPTTGDYVPAGHVAVIAEIEPDPTQPAAPWPWVDLAPAAFVQPGDGDPVPFPKHVLTAAQVDALGVDVGPGGTGGLRFTGPDGKGYLVAIVPALPETAGS